MHQGFGLIACFHIRPALFVRFSIGFSFLNHPFNISIIQTARCLNTDFLLFASGFVLGAHLDDTVCINIKRNLNLWHAARGWRNALKIELTKMLVVSRHFTFALIHRNGHRRLVIISGREHLAFLRWNGGVAID